MKSKFDKFQKNSIASKISMIKGGAEKTTIDARTTDWHRYGLGDKEVTWVFGSDGWVRIVVY